MSFKNDTLSTTRLSRSQGNSKAGSLCNFHTHTSFCDGADTPRELVEVALQKGMRALGFSGHTPLCYGDPGTMTLDGENEYKQEVLRLRDEYEGRIEIYLGLENDAIDPHDRDDYEYIVGAVHFVVKDGERYCVDMSMAEMDRALRDGFSGDGLALIRNYFEQMVHFTKNTRPDILAHFDLPVKFNSGNRYFDEESPAYQKLALEALEAASAYCQVVELNTGGMARGYRDTPYPAPFILKRLHELKCPVILSADAHQAQNLDFAFDNATELLRQTGFSERAQFGKNGFYMVEL
ncbi:histidinol-phosphatase [Eubacteriales bacterium OttesenSCG-928-K08]|nr:histidinol-phosphatase [Eubacteriales bacterium OttesenSCG-928-K08]